MTHGDITQVPDFHAAKHGDFQPMIGRYLLTQGIKSVYMVGDVLTQDAKEGSFSSLWFDTKYYCIFSGRSPRDPENMWHAVVGSVQGYQKKLVFDPYPGIQTEEHHLADALIGPMTAMRILIKIPEDS